MEWVPGNPNDRSVTGFRIRHGSSRGPMSKSTYHRLKKEGSGPRETRVNGLILITLEDERRWEAERANPTDTEARLIAKVDAMRLARARRAGRRSADGPSHISKRKQGAEAGGRA